MTASPPAHVYILRLRSGRHYVGATRDLEGRVTAHLARHGGGRTTSRDPAVALVYSERHANMSAALKRECQLKRWSRAKKEALIARDIQALRRLSHHRDK